MKSIIAAVAVAGLMVTGSAMAADFSLSSCKACHAIDKDGVGPSFKEVTAKYGDAKTLEGVFKAGFKEADRKVAAASDKWKKPANLSTMTGQFNSSIKGKETAAAEAIFAAVKAGKM
jgi:cytochrome c551/c552